MTVIGRNRPRVWTTRETNEAQGVKEKQQPVTADGGSATGRTAQTKAPVDAKTQASARGRIAARGADLAQRVPEPNRLAADVKSNGLESNQDLINHAYKQSTQGLQNSEENFSKASAYLKDNYNVDMKTLVANRSGKIDTDAGQPKVEVPTSDQAQAENKVAQKESQANVPTSDQAQAENKVAQKESQTATGEAAEAPGMMKAQPFAGDVADARARSGLEGQLNSLRGERSELLGKIRPEDRGGHAGRTARQSNQRIRGQVEQLDKRIGGLEGQLEASGASALDAQTFRHNQLLERYDNAGGGHSGRNLRNRLKPQIEESFKMLEELRGAEEKNTPSIPEGGIWV